MIPRADIQAFVNDVVRKFRPSRVILFGSYAYGQPNEDSDVDLMVVLPHRGPSPQLAGRIRLACPHDFPMDLIVRSPAELRRRLKMGDSFLQEVTSRGIVLHEINDDGMDDKAEADYAAALLVRRSRKKHSRDIVCFHLQQCVEKYLKGRLEEAGLSFPRTHDVLRLLNLVLPVEPLWVTLQPAMSTISSYAVETRYPGRNATASETTMLLKAATRIRKMIRLSLGLH